MAVKKTVIVARPFKDRDGKDHRIGERIEVDPDYGVELEREGNVHPDQSLPTGGAKPDQSLPTPPKAEPK